MDWLFFMCFGKRLSLEVSCFFLIERSSREVGGGSAYKKNLSDVLRLGAENGARTRDLALRGLKRHVTPWRQGRRPLGG